jgi:hypothetical protein
VYAKTATPWERSSTGSNWPRRTNAGEKEIAGACSASAIEVWWAFCLLTRAFHNSIGLNLAKVWVGYQGKEALLNQEMPSITGTMRNRRKVDA